MAFAPPANEELAGTAGASRTFAWIVFALIFGLLLSDYMSRQVLNSVFPLLKSQWSLSDTQLGSLSSVVSLMVGLLTFPLSLVADRWGRVASLKAMALLWSLATLACGFARNYEEMFAARFLIGVGEAAYGSVGIAVILSVFPPHLRSTLSGSFLAGGVFGSVLGMGIGGAVAARMGWRWSFIAMACFGLALLVAFALAVTEKRLDPQRRHAARMASSKHLLQFRALLPGLFSARSVIFAYLGNGLQLFMVGSLIAWMPSFLNREYGLATARASALAAAFVLLSGVGMIVCGWVTDRVSRRAPVRKFRIAIGLSLCTFALLGAGFHLGPGTAQLVLIGLGTFLAAGTTGPSTAMVANVTHISIHSTAFATLSLANNLLGMAPGPVVTGMLADRWGLAAAFGIVPLVCVAAAASFALGARHYASDIARLGPAEAAAPPA
ncbi:MAG TPA: MFS transporter [Usitatibacter sp.]|jgi:MFS family permease|nr:MFS transporter [Usitatibacter sp.]